MREWISVAESMPEVNNPVLTSRKVMTSYSNGSWCDVQDVCSWNGKNWIYDGYVIYGITHWMPLPEGPDTSGISEKELYGHNRE